MGIFNILKKITGRKKDSDENYHSSYSRRHFKKCLIKVDVTLAEFVIMSKFYYQGHTSYRSFIKYVFIGKIEKIIDLMHRAQRKARSGCDIDDTFVAFYHDEKRFLIIPFEVFSEKKNMPLANRNLKSWNRDNILRILSLYPEFRDYDKAMVTESDIMNLLFGE